MTIMFEAAIAARADQSVFALNRYRKILEHLSNGLFLDRLAHLPKCVYYDDRCGVYGHRVPAAWTVEDFHLAMPGSSINRFLPTRRLPRIPRTLSAADAFVHGIRQEALYV